MLLEPGLEEERQLVYGDLHGFLAIAEQGEGTRAEVEAHPLRYILRQ